MPTDDLLARFSMEGEDALLNTYEKLASVTSVAEDAQDRYTQSLGRVADNVSGAADALGGFSQSMIDNFNEGEGAAQKLSAMLEKRGEGGRIEELDEWASKLSMDAAMVDDDPIKDAAAGLLGFGISADQVKQIMPGLIGQSETYNQSLETTARAFGAAFSRGKVDGLVRSGVTIDPADIEKLNGVEDRVERQKMLLEMVKGSMDQYALSIGQGMGQAEMSANRFANTMDGVESTIGEGAANARASWQGVMTPFVDDLQKTHPELLKMIGYTAEAGSTAGHVLAPILEYGSQAAELLQTFRLGKILQATATGANATALGAETFAVGINTEAQIANAAAAGRAGAARRAGMFSGGPGGALGAVGMGLGLGALGYEAIRSTGALDDEDGEAPPGFTEAAGNAAGRIGAFIMTGDKNNYDNRAQGQMADENIKVIQAKRAQAKVGDNGRIVVQMPDFELPSTRGDDLADEAASYGMDD